MPTSGGTHFAILVRIMEIRIDITSEGPETVVRIAGRLSGVAVAQLRKACDPIEGAFVIDLSNLLFADATGIDVIRATVEKGAEVRGASPFVQLLLDDTPWIRGRMVRNENNLMRDYDERKNPENMIRLCGEYLRQGNRSKKEEEEFCAIIPHATDCFHTQF